MPTGVQLSQLIAEARLEAGHSANVAHGQNSKATVAQLLNRIQAELAVAYDWPGLMVRRDVTLGAGTRHYAFPAGLDFQQVQEARVLVSGRWLDVDYGIRLADFAQHDSEAGEQSWPVRRWEVDGDDNGQFEVWPIPDQAGTLRLRGPRVLATMVNDSDTCTLDSTVLVLMAAGEMLARQKSQDAQVKFEKAQGILRHLRRRVGSDKRQPAVLNGQRSTVRPRFNPRLR